MAPRNREIIAHPKLSSTAKLALLWLRSTAKRGYSYESNASLAVVLGIKPDTVSAIARELDEAGLVTRERGGIGSGARKRWVLLPTESSLVPKRTAFWHARGRSLRCRTA